MNTTYTPLFLAVSIPTLVSLVGLLLNRSDFKELSNKFENFRLEMTKELGVINTRLAVIEYKLGIPPAVKPDTKDAA